jgi:uncharacterized protein
MREQQGTASRNVMGYVVASSVLLAAVTLLLWSMQERIAYQPQRGPYPSPPEAVRVDYRASDGQPLLGYIVGDTSEANGILLAFHGNADLAALQVPWAEEVAERTGHAVFLAEYRGYMGLPGRPTYAGLRLDALAAYDFLVDSLGARPHEIAVFGHSLGTAIAVELAAERPIRAVLLQSPFTSSRDMASRMVSMPLATVLHVFTRVPYDTRAHVSRLDAPVWVIHGQRDLIVPTRMGRVVHQSVKRKGSFVVIEGAGHNDVHVADGERYWKWVAAALGSTLAAVESD